MTTKDIYILHAGNTVDGSTGRVTMFDYEEDAREVYDFMVSESLVSINQGLTITKLDGVTEEIYAELTESAVEAVESEFEEFDATVVANYGSTQESWDKGIFNEDSQEVLDALEENDELVIHS